jgi:hypothetical protein
MMEGGFEAWPALDEMFPTSYQGVNHNRGVEGGIISYTEHEVKERLRGYFGAKSFADALAAFLKVSWSVAPCAWMVERAAMGQQHRTGKEITSVGSCRSCRPQRAEPRRRDCWAQ